MRIIQKRDSFTPSLEVHAVLLLLLLCSPAVLSAAYSAYKSPDIDRRAIAGLWRLTPRIVPSFPIKEFTVYPKKQTPSAALPATPPLQDVLLMLKEDGSFQQYEQESSDQVDVDASWTEFQLYKAQKESIQALVKGIWDYRDGNLILAADRPASPYASVAKDGTLAKEETEPSSKKQAVEDTLLEGKVVATYDDALQDNPALTFSSEKGMDGTSSLSSSVKGADGDPTSLEASNVPPACEAAASSTDDNSIDTHLSVPKGSVKVGKFFYPKRHPSFFEQPMFQPVRRGSFSLRQVLGSLNTQNPQDEVIEKFQRHDFYNKTFMLTSHPIGHHLPKGRPRWSIKYNKYVHDAPSKEAQEAADAEKAAPVPNIRVMQVQFHANNTFSSVAGLGESILRGKFDILGQARDQLWMQVIRFGFGRGVSGSVYSEGRMLTQEDAKTYWGTIDFEKDENEQHESASEVEASVVLPEPTEAIEGAATDVVPERLEVKGSVLLGSGLEPMPVARFIMREVTEMDTLDDYDEEEEDEEEEESGDGIDWSDAFQ